MSAKKVWIPAVSAAALVVVHVLAQPPVRKPPTFTAGQATQGKSAYDQNCASCHGDHLDDGQFGPPLSGAIFKQQWGGKTGADLFTYMSTKMPPANVGGLGDQVYAQIMAYVLQGNGVEASQTALPSDAKLLASMMIPGGQPGGRGSPGGGLSPFASLPPAPKVANPLDRITPVTDAMLRNPPPGDWLIWRRTYDDQGFSPLKAIDKSNVSNMRLVWSWSLPGGPDESTPLIHDGVMFVHGYGDHIEALNAATGDLLWEYSYPLPKDARVSVKRDISLAGNTLIFGTSDMHVLALNVKDGKVIWDHAIADYKERWQLTGGPLVAKDKVMVGTGGQHPGGNFIVALDLKTGKEEWRFHVIPQEGEPNGNTWNGVPVEKRNGGSVWTAGSYDPALNLAFFGPAQTYDTGPYVHKSTQPGVNNDLLYTDTTLAIDPDTGKVKWYFQHTPNDQWDLDWAFERQLVDLPINGVNRRIVITSGKMALYDAMDAATGKYEFSIDLGLQNVVTSIDPKTGAKTYNPKVMPGQGEVLTVCPHAGGAKSWLPASYNATSRMLYVPLVESCMDLIPVKAGGRGSLSSGLRFSIRPRLDTDGKFGRLDAVNLETHKVAWIDRQRAPRTTGVLATAGGVVFGGSMDRYVQAYDADNGKLLWQTRLNDVPVAPPVTYSVNGKQYVAFSVGNGSAQAITWPPLLPDIKNPPGGGAAVWVFALPDKN
jgi:PQQ-dependent dehydrogenase (methanol/ethanol family)